MDSLIARALDTASARGASYSDARMVDTAQERYSVRTGVVDVISTDESMGIGRCGWWWDAAAWGFASTSTMTARGRRPGHRAGGGDRQGIGNFGRAESGAGAAAGNEPGHVYDAR